MRRGRRKDLYTRETDFLEGHHEEAEIQRKALRRGKNRTLLISFCTVQLWTFCTAQSLATLCLFTTTGPDPGELPGFWGSMVIRHAPIPWKGSDKQQQQQQAAIGNELEIKANRLIRKCIMLSGVP